MKMFGCFSEQEQADVITGFTCSMKRYTDGLDENIHVDHDEANCSRKSKSAVEWIDVRKE